jgi:hypothetical protein
MKSKYIIEIRENDELIFSTQCKTYREMALLTNEDYHNIRAIHMIGNGTSKRKYLHPTLQKLLKKIKIIDL